MEGLERVTILNRSLDRADALAEHFNAAFRGERVRTGTLAEAANHTPNTGLIVNTTALGMDGKPQLDVPVGRFADAATVADIVYTPLETDLLKQARERGHPVVDGLGMLLHQAVPGFHHWFGVKPVVTDDLRQLVLADLTANTKA